LTITQCSLPADNNYYLSHQRGFDNWEAIASRNDIDVFSTSIIVDYNAPLSVHRKIAKQTVDLARKNNKKSQRWVMSYFDSPADLEFIKQIVHAYADAGVDSIFSWTYKAGKDTFLSAPDPDAVWNVLTEAFGEVLDK
ncbi:MAG: hypothetical protein JXR63_03575, partial [Spirochaetales bacterium]|nr:hypothetical protein [Spirochaetales bacterium]